MKWMEEPPRVEDVEANEYDSVFFSTYFLVVFVYVFFMDEYFISGRIYKIN